MPRIKACLFDMDGLLIDSERIYTETTERLLSMYGREAHFPVRVKSEMMGRPGPEAAAIFLTWSGIDMTPDAYRAEQAALQASRFPDVELMPGAADLLHALTLSVPADVSTRHDHDHKVEGPATTTTRTRGPVEVALATSSTRSNYALKTTRHRDLFSLFRDAVVCGDDGVVAGRGKPEPDIFLHALRLINDARERGGRDDAIITPDECLVLEDGVPGVQAGLRAGMHVLWVPDREVLAVHEGRVDEILGDRGRMVDSLERFPWSYYGLER